MATVVVTMTIAAIISRKNNNVYVNILAVDFTVTAVIVTFGNVLMDSTVTIQNY